MPKAPSSNHARFEFEARVRAITCPSEACAEFDRVKRARCDAILAEGTSDAERDAWGWAHKLIQQKLADLCPGLAEVWKMYRTPSAMTDAEIEADLSILNQLVDSGIVSVKERRAELENELNIRADKAAAVTSSAADISPEDAQLILDHMAITTETVEPVEDTARNLDSYWDGGECCECRVRTEVAGRVFKSSERVFSTYAGDPYGGMSRACYEGACDCDECYVDDRDEVEVALEEMRAKISEATIEDATSSNHRAIVYAALLQQAREARRRLNEIPAHIDEAAA